MRTTALLALTLASMLAGACQGGPPEAHAPRGPVVVAETLSSDGRPAPAQVVDLLHSVACVVAVSSKVDNPKDFPEHLVDGKTETAWNGKTGDLHGFIAFRTPEVTRVKRVELTVGFDKVGPSGDLFTKNHRITKVRLSRGERVVKEVDLDPEIRALQGFDVDEAGGDFKLDVLATLPGSEKKWQELVVSELRVLGLANGAPESPQHLPAMAIGSLDGVAPRKTGRGEPPAGPFATLEELCAAYDKAMTPLIDAAFPGDRYPGKIGGPHCKPLDDPEVPALGAKMTTGPFVSAVWMHVNDPARESARMVVRSERGFSFTKIALWARYHDDPGCGHASSSSFEDATVVKANLDRDVVIVRMLQTDIYWLGSTDPGGTVESAYACGVDARGAATCDGPLVSGRSSGWPDGWDVSKGTFPAVTVANTAWKFRRPPILGPAGDLRLTP
jgi:hypothetical protein